MTWYRPFLLTVLTCTIHLPQAFSQEEGDQVAAATSFSEEEVLPNYQYEYIPDFTYDQVDQRIKSMDLEMPFKLNDRIFSFIQYFTVRNRDYTKMVLARKDLFFPMFDEMMEKHDIHLPRNLVAGVESGELEKMVDVALVLEPLWENALGADWKQIMTRDKIKELYQKM